MATHLLKLFTFGRGTGGGDDSTFRVEKNGELSDELSVVRIGRQSHDESV
jgi:hypothetical protein